MTTTTPERSLDQRMTALGHANEVRTYRALYKHLLRSGEIDIFQIVDAIRYPPDEMASMKVRDLLLAIPKLGPAKTQRLLRLADVSPVKTLGGISDRQRRELAAYVTVVHPDLRKVSV